MALVNVNPTEVHLLTVARSPLSYVAGEDMAVGDAVYYGSDGRIYKALSDAKDHANAIGVVVAGGYKGTVKAGQAVDVSFDGVLSGFAGTLGAIVYVSAEAGKLSDTPPTSGYKMPVGIITSDGLMLRLGGEPVALA